MQKPSVMCALLAAMIAKHTWGSPIDEEHLIAIAAIDPNDAPVAREVYEGLRVAPSIANRGKRGIELDTGAFGQLSEILYHECGWEPFQIKSRLKHYEGWETHDWA